MLLVASLDQEEGGMELSHQKYQKQIIQYQSNCHSDNIYDEILTEKCPYPGGLLDIQDDTVGYDQSQSQSSNDYDGSWPTVNAKDPSLIHPISCEPNISDRRMDTMKNCKRKIERGYDIQISSSLTKDLPIPDALKSILAVDSLDDSDPLKPSDPKVLLKFFSFWEGMTDTMATCIYWRGSTRTKKNSFSTVTAPALTTSTTCRNCNSSMKTTGSTQRITTNGNRRISTKQNDACKGSIMAQECHIELIERETLRYDHDLKLSMIKDGQRTTKTQTLTSQPLIQSPPAPLHHKKQPPYKKNTIVPRFYLNGKYVYVSIINSVWFCFPKEQNIACNSAARVTTRTEEKNENEEWLNPSSKTTEHEKGLSRAHKKKRLRYGGASTSINRDTEAVYQKGRFYMSCGDESCINPFHYKDEYKIDE